MKLVFQDKIVKTKYSVPECRVVSVDFENCVIMNSPGQPGDDEDYNDQGDF